MENREHAREGRPPEGDGRVSQILHRLADDVKTIARDEVELGRIELEDTARRAAGEAAAVMLGAIVALIGLGLLCVSAVDALEPAISPLWLRLLIMAVVYVGIGGGLVAVFVRRLRREVNPDITRVTAPAAQAIDGVRRGIED